MHVGDDMVQQLAIGQHTLFSLSIVLGKQTYYNLSQGLYD